MKYLKPILAGITMTMLFVFYLTVALVLIAAIVAGLVFLTLETIESPTWWIIAIDVFVILGIITALRNKHIRKTVVAIGEVIWS